MCRRPSLTEGLRTTASTSCMTLRAKILFSTCISLTTEEISSKSGRFTSRRSTTRSCSSLNRENFLVFLSRETTYCLYSRVRTLTHASIIFRARRRYSKSRFRIQNSEAWRPDSCLINMTNTSQYAPEILL